MTQLKERLRKILKTRHSIILGEIGLEDLRRKISRFSNVKIKICGRSFKTGRKRTVNISVIRLFGR